MESAPHPRRGSLAPEGGHRDPREDNNSGLVAKTVSETAKRDTLQSGTAKRDCKAKLQRETAERDCKARLSKAGLQSETAERDCQARLSKAGLQAKRDCPKPAQTHTSKLSVAAGTSMSTRNGMIMVIGGMTVQWGPYHAMRGYDGRRAGRTFKSCRESLEVEVVGSLLDAVAQCQ